MSESNSPNEPVTPAPLPSAADKDLLTTLERSDTASTLRKDTRTR